MSEAAAPAPSAAPTSTPQGGPSEVQSQGQAPANDNAQARSEGAPPPANDNAQPSTEDVFHAENLGDFAEKKWRIKNGDQERVVDTRELLRLSQIGHAGYDAFRRAAEEKRAIAEQQQRFEQQRQALEQGLRTNPLGIIRKLGLEEALYAELEQELAYQQLPPDQRERADIQREREQVARERQEWQRQQEAAQRQAYERQIQAQAQQAEQTFRQQYTSALEGAGVPQSAHADAMRLMAAAHEQALSAGVDVPVEVLAQRARDRLAEMARAFAPPPDKARDFYGEEWVRSVQQHDVQRIAQTRAPNGQFTKAQAQQQPQQNGPKERARFTSMRDFKKALDGK